MSHFSDAEVKSLPLKLRGFVGGEWGSQGKGSLFPYLRLHKKDRKELVNFPTAALPAQIVREGEEAE